MRLRFSSRPRIHLGAFGKHPAWDDHMDDFGLESDRLVGLRRVMYTQGIAGRVDSGAWERLGAGERLAGFDHVVLWSTGEGAIAGRLLASADGKGRTRYPLALLVHGLRVGEGWVFGRGVRALEELHERIREERDEGRVVAALEDARERLRREASEGGGSDAGDDGASSALREIARHPQAGEDAVGARRVLYHVRREMPALLSKRAGGGGASPRHVRAPRCAGTALDGARLWVAAMRGLVDARAPVMAIAPAGAGLVDLIVGEPAAEQFYCLLAGAGALPMASEIPYEIDEASRALTDELLGGA